MTKLLAAMALACAMTAPAAALTRVRSPAAADLYRDGRLRYAAHDYAGALRAFEASYRLDPTPTMWINIAQCLRALGRDTDAVAAYQRFLDGAGGNPELRAEVFEALDELKKRDLVRPLTATRDAQAAERYYRGKLAYGTGDWPRALDEFHAAYARSPAPALLVDIGHALHKLDRPAEAIAAYRTFLEQPLGARRLRLEVFEALDGVRRELDARMFKLAEAAALFQRYLDEGRGTPEVRVVMHATVKQTLAALAELDRQASARYVVGGSTALAQRRSPRPIGY